MNRILFAVRRARGLTEKQVAEALSIEESEYLELECDFKKMPIDTRCKLEDFYDIPGAYFSLYDACDVDDRTEILREYKEDLSSMIDLDLPAKLHINVLKMGTENLILHDEVRASFLRQRELEKENEVLRKLYEEVKLLIKPSTKKLKP